MITTSTIQSARKGDPVGKAASRKRKADAPIFKPPRPGGLECANNDILSILVLVLLSESTFGVGPRSPDIRLTPVSKANLCVTEGSIEETPDHRLSVNVAKMRAYVNAYTQPVAQVQLRLPGLDTRQSAPRIWRNAAPVWPQAACSATRATSCMQCGASSLNRNSSCR